jgi:mono/diheme cytochrome c family protein
MRRTRFLGILLCGLALPTFAVRAQTLRDRGEYLVVKVANCGACHTPLTPEGRPDTARLLKGARIKGVAAPDITASGDLWARWSEEDFLRFLKAGVEPSGRLAKYPMAPFQLRPDDAAAIVEYLQTLK